MLMATRYILPLLILAAIIVSYEQSAVFASPAFARQEIRDESVDWIDMDTHLRTEGSPFTDIQVVSYLSDGKVLNVTFWLLTSFVEKPSSDMVSYGMLIDVDANNETGWHGIDYMTKIMWKNKTWTKILEEWSSHGESRLLDNQTNYAGFFDKQKRYVLLSLNLDTVGFPEQYRVVFFTQQLFKKENPVHIIGDFTRWVHIPPPEFVVSTSPSFLQLRAGDQKIIEVQIKSVTGFRSLIQLFSKTIESDLEVKFTPDEFELPPYGTDTAALQINVREDKEPGPYRVSVSANATFPEFFIEEGVSNDINFKVPFVKNENVTSRATLMMDLQNAPSLGEKFMAFWGVVGDPLNFALAIATGIGGWFLAKIKRKNKQKR